MGLNLFGAKINSLSKKKIQTQMSYSKSGPLTKIFSVINFTSKLL